MSNNGFVNVDTAPAGAHSSSVPGLGTFSYGSGPTIGDDGTLFLGTREGKVIALHPDGSPFWTRDLPSNEPIWCSPAVGADGSVYVVGVRRADIRDHRTGGAGHVIVDRATLYKFDKAGGAPAGNFVVFPDFPSAARPDHFGPAAVSPPKVWRFGNDEAILFLASYTTVGGYDLHLLAFSSSLQLIADKLVAYWGGEISAEPGPFTFTEGILPEPKLPRVAIFTNPQGGTPAITICNNGQREIVGFMFCVGSSCVPAPGFTELFRTRVTDDLRSSPTILPNLHTAVGTDKGVAFGGPNATMVPPVKTLNAVYAAVTPAADNRVMVVDTSGRLVVLANNTIIAQSPPLGS